MIVQLTHDEYPADEFGIGLGGPLTIEEMADRARVRPGTYAYTLIATLHWEIFHQCLDLKRDYDLYFSAEYPTFSDYLARRHRFTPAFITVLADLYSRFSMVLLYVPNMTFLAEEFGYELLTSVLGDRDS